MTDFVFGETAPTGKVISAALGVDANSDLNTNDIGKAVKLGASQNYTLCADGDEIEGFVTSVESFTVNDGWSFGGVVVNGRKEVEVGSEEVGVVSIGELVVAGAQVAANTAGVPKVKGGAPTTHMWRCIRHITGTGAAGDTILIERVGT